MAGGREDGAAPRGALPDEPAPRIPQIVAHLLDRGANRMPRNRVGRGRPSLEVQIGDPARRRELPERVFVLVTRARAHVARRVVPRAMGRVRPHPRQIRIAFRHLRGALPVLPHVHRTRDVRLEIRLHVDRREVALDRAPIERPRAAVIVGRQVRQRPDRDADAVVLHPLDVGRIVGAPTDVIMRGVLVMITTRHGRIYREMITAGRFVAGKDLLGQRSVLKVDRVQFREEDHVVLRARARAVRAARAVDHKLAAEVRVGRIRRCGDRVERDRRLLVGAQDHTVTRARGAGRRGADREVLIGQVRDREEPRRIRRSVRPRRCAPDGVHKRAVDRLPAALYEDGQRVGRGWHRVRRQRAATGEAGEGQTAGREE